MRKYLNIMIYTTNTPEETQDIAKNLALETINNGGIIALIGDLGAGKTTFTQGFARGLGITEKINSPTFVLMHQHQIPESKKILYHLDLYRLKNTRDIEQIGIQELLDNTDQNIILIEWAEKVESLLPKNIIKISIKKSPVNENQRIIEINNVSNEQTEHREEYNNPKS